MPVHRVSTAAPDLESAVAQIERNQQIIGVTSEGPGSVLVFTTRRPGRPAKETR